MSGRFSGGIQQDWEPLVLHKRRTKADLRTPKAVNQALRTGGHVETVKKFAAGTNKTNVSGVNARRLLENAEEAAALDKISMEVRQAIQKARKEKNLSQAELAKQINVRLQVVQEYENGKAVPDQAILAKMEKALGAKLRGLKK